MKGEPAADAADQRTALSSRHELSLDVAPKREILGIDDKEWQDPDCALIVWEEWPLVDVHYRQDVTG